MLFSFSFCDVMHRRNGAYDVMHRRNGAYDVMHLRNCAVMQRRDVADATT